MPKATETTVHVREFAVLAHVGQHAKERNTPQVIIVDIDCTLRRAEVKEDKIKNTVDYVPITEAVEERCLNRRRRLIETLAKEIAMICFRRPLVAKVRVSIHKPFKITDCTAVGITRTFNR